MRFNGFRLIIWMALFSLFFSVSPALAGLREGISIRKGYKPGMGAALGETVLVQGKVYIVHAKTDVAYVAKSSLPLFRGDGITTLKKGRIRIALGDGSILTMASESDLVISRSLYHPERKSRSSFINMGKGKVRFFVKKFLEFKQTEFKVKTTTAILGVRGSDFIVKATETSTEVITLGDTELEVISLAAPDMPPVILEDFERTVIDAGEAPREVEEATRELIEIMTEDMRVTPEGPDVELREQERPKGEPVKVETPEGILVPESDLLSPEITEIPREIEPPPRPEITGAEDLREQVDNVKGQQEDILEEKQRDIMERIEEEEAPNFPGKPY